MTIHAGIEVLNVIFALWFLFQNGLILGNRDEYARPLVLTTVGFISCVLSALTILSLLK